MPSACASTRTSCGDWKAGTPATHPEFGSYATLTYGIGRERYRIDWLEWMITRLQ